jgi:hypothetical protein
VAPSRKAFDDLSMSIGDIVYVPNATARAQLVSDLAAGGYAPSSTRPLYVHRGDAPAGMELERTANGTDWRPVNNTTWTGQVGVPPIPGSGSVNVTVTFPAGYFSHPPHILLTIQNSSQAIATNAAATTTSVACTVRNFQTTQLSGVTLTVLAHVQP